MTHEGGEHDRRGRESHDTDEPPETDEMLKSAQEMMRELRREIEDDTEAPESDEPPMSAQDVVKEARADVEEKERKQPASDEDMEGDGEIPGEAQQCVRDAIQELSERKGASREHESEKQEDLERTQEECEEFADNDSYEDLERKFLESLEDKGGDAEDAKEQWREQFVRDIEEYLQESKNEQESDNEGEEGERSSQSSTAESLSHYDDGSGQMYEVRTKPEAESTTEAELEPNSEQAETATETMESPEGEPKGESTQTDVPHQEKETEGSPETQEHSKAREPSDESVQEKTTPRDEAIKDLPEGSISSEEHEELVETGCNEKETGKTVKIHPERVHDESCADEKTSESSEKCQSTEIEHLVVNEKEVDAEVSQPEETREKKDESEEESVEDKCWKKRLLELYEEMPEEWKEAFREYLRGLVEDEDDFERLIEKHGLEHLLEDEEVMEEIRRFFKFKMALNEQGEEELERVAEELGIDSELAEQWANGEAEPRALKNVLNHEAYWTFWELVRHKTELDSPNTKEELETILKDNPMLELDDRMVPFEQWKRDARAWIEIMNAKKRGEIGVRLQNSREIYHREDIERLSEKYDVPIMEVISWLRGEKVPVLIRKVRKLRNIYRNNIWVPEIGGIEIKTSKQLDTLLGTHYPSTRNRSDLRKLMSSIEIHLAVYLAFHGRNLITSNEIHRLAKALKIPAKRVRRIVREGLKPRLYHYLNKEPSLSEKIGRVNEILLKLNGVSSMEAANCRLEMLYYIDELRRMKSHDTNIQNALHFFRFLNEYVRGGTRKALSAKTKAGTSSLSEWLNARQFPTYAKYAASIPLTPLRSGWRWLPFRLNPMLNMPEEFMQIPLGITSPDDLIEAVDNLKSLDSPVMEKYEQKFGKVSKPLALMYLLGLLFSDGTFKFDTDLSAKVILSASVKYPWSAELGDAFCYALGKLGLSAERRQNSRRKKRGKLREFMVWESEASPFLMWLKKTLLGLNPSDKKKEVPVQSDWILEMPREWRIAFVQGLSDGDGYASLKTFRVGIASKTNQHFIKRLLASFNIDSKIDKTKVVIHRYGDIIKANSLPLFKHASSRQERHNHLQKIIEKRSTSRKKVQSNEANLIMAMHERGLSPGQITERLWLEYKIARTTKSVDGIIRRRKGK